MSIFDGFNRFLSPGAGYRSRCSSGRLLVQLSSTQTRHYMQILYLNSKFQLLILLPCPWLRSVIMFITNSSYFYIKSVTESIRHFLASRIASEMLDVRIFLSIWPTGQVESRELVGVSRFPQILTATTN